MIFYLELRLYSIIMGIIDCASIILILESGEKEKPRALKAPHSRLSPSNSNSHTHGDIHVIMEMDGDPRYKG